MLPGEYCAHLEYYWTSLHCFMTFADASSNHFGCEGLSLAHSVVQKNCISKNVPEFWLLVCPVLLTTSPLSHHTALPYSLTRLGMLTKHEDWFYSPVVELWWYCALCPCDTHRFNFTFSPAYLL